MEKHVQAAGNVRNSICKPTEGSTFMRNITRRRHVVVAESLQQRRSLKITLATQLPSAQCVSIPHFQFFFEMYPRSSVKFELDTSLSDGGRRESE